MGLLLPGGRRSFRAATAGRAFTSGPEGRRVNTTCTARARGRQSKQQGMNLGQLGKSRPASGHVRGPARAQGIDRMIQNIETGHFERSLSALTAAGALVTAAEIFFEHDSASFGNKMMWIPVVLGPVGAAAGVAGFFSRRDRGGHQDQGAGVPAALGRLTSRTNPKQVS